MEMLLVQYCKKLHFGSNIVANATSISAGNNIDFLTELSKKPLKIIASKEFKFPIPLQPKI